MCYFNNNCGCGSSGESSVPYYVNPCGWYTVGRVAVLALVSIDSDCGCNNNGCGNCGC